MPGVYSIFEKPGSSSKQLNGTSHTVVGASKDKPVTRSKGKRGKLAEDSESSIDVDNTSNKRASSAKPVERQNAPIASTSAQSTADPKKARELHPFFSKSSQKATAPADDPIVVPDSPVRTSTPTFADAERLKRQRLHEYRPYHARWPGPEDIHVGAEETARAEGELPFRRKGKGRATDSPSQWHFIPMSFQSEANAMRQPAFVCQCEEDIEQSLPADQHPLMSRIARMALDEDWRGDEGAELWTSKYAPTCAAEVMGDVSGKSATTLVDWLRELAIKGKSTSGSPSRRQIRRQISPKKRQKKAGEFDDFIADEVDDPVIDLMRDPRLGTPVSSPMRGSPQRSTPRSSTTKSAFDDLTNLMLLEGPPGSGKTAAVYAAAKELNFEVFELSSNEARSGKDLERYFGGMTTNEHLHKGKQATNNGTSPRRNSFFGLQAGAQGSKKRKAIVLESDDVPDAVPRQTRSSDIRQSLILVEEVDVLFPEDKSFWEALVSLVSKSLRAIVMTCNDASRLPLQHLPVQETLLFRPVELHQATSFLRTVALAEGHIVPAKDLKLLYKLRNDQEPRVPPSAVGPRPLPPVPRHRLDVVCDLRQALSQMQMFCEVFRPEDEPFVDWTDSHMDIDDADADSDLKAPPTLQHCARLSSCLSFADAYIERSPLMYVEDYDSHVAPGSDIEVGYEVLQLGNDPLRFPILPDWAREQDMVASVQMLGLKVYGEWPITILAHDSPSFEFDRRRFCQQAELATTILPLSAPLLPAASITADYLPLLCAIVLADDLHEAAFDPNSPATMAPGQARRTMTRASARKYERHLEIAPLGPLAEESANALRGLVFSFNAYNGGC